MKPHADSAPAVAALLTLGRQFIHELAKEIVAAMASGAVDDEIDQRSKAALQKLRLSERRYLEAARDGLFPSERRGRRVVARLRDVEAWRNRKKEPAEIVRPSPQMSADDEERVLLGLRPKGELRVVGGAGRG